MECWSGGVYEITKYKHQNTSKFQYPMTTTCLQRYFFEMAQKFENLNFDHCDLPFDSFDLEALDRW
jgi:hypothetical protein